jgi:hypothetical protein
MWMLIFLLMRVQAAPAAQAGSDLDFNVFKTRVQPLLLEKRPGHARCVVCHSTGTAFRLQALSPGAKDWNDEQTQKNFEMIKKFVLPGVPTKSRLLVMPLAHEAGGTEFHPGGKHWESKTDPEWAALADWVNGKK